MARVYWRAPVLFFIDNNQHISPLTSHIFHWCRWSFVTSSQMCLHEHKTTIIYLEVLQITASVTDQHRYIVRFLWQISPETQGNGFGGFVIKFNHFYLSPTFNTQLEYPLWQSNPSTRVRLSCLLVNLRQKDNRAGLLFPCKQTTLFSVVHRIH